MISLTPPLDSTVPKKSLYIHLLLFISFNSPLNLFYSGFCLHQFPKTLLSSSLATSSLPNPMISFQLTSYLPAAFDKADYSCFPETLGFLGDYNIPILALWLGSHPPLPNLPISKCYSGPWLSFLLSTLTPLLISNLIRVLNAISLNSLTFPLRCLKSHLKFNVPKTELLVLLQIYCSYNPPQFNKRHSILQLFRTKAESTVTQLFLSHPICNFTTAYN